MDRLAGLGYLDDAAFAAALVRRRAGSRGPALIAQELAAKGVDRETARAALGEAGRESQLAAALRLARRHTGLDSRALAGRLLARGFPWEVVRAACRQVAGSELSLD